MWPQWPPYFGPASLDFHLNRPVISLIQLHIVSPPGWNCAPIAPHLASARTAPAYLAPMIQRKKDVSVASGDSSFWWVISAVDNQDVVVVRKFGWQQRLVLVCWCWWSCVRASFWRRLFLCAVSDARNEDSGNYTCEVHGSGYQSTVLAHVVHHLFVRGQSQYRYSLYRTSATAPFNPPYAWLGKQLRIKRSPGNKWWNYFIVTFYIRSAPYDNRRWQCVLKVLLNPLY